MSKMVWNTPAIIGGDGRFQRNFRFASFQGAIDVTEIHIEKPKLQAFADYYFYKWKVYNFKL
jgi:hypothetical protein